jgi:hypothetical protein
MLRVRRRPCRAQPTAMDSPVRPCPSILLLAPTLNLRHDAAPAPRRVVSCCCFALPRRPAPHCLTWISITHVGFGSRILFFSWKISLLGCTGSLDAYYSTELLNWCILYILVAMGKQCKIQSCFKENEMKKLLNIHLLLRPFLLLVIGHSLSFGNYMRSFLLEKQEILVRPGLF